MGAYKFKNVSSFITHILKEDVFNEIKNPSHSYVKLIIFYVFVKVEELQKELEETRELANNRLQELDKLHQTHRDTLKEVEKLKMDVSVIDKI